MAEFAGGKRVKNKIKSPKNMGTDKKKNAFIFISAIVAALVVILTVAVGLTLYFNSPAYAASRLVRAVKEKDANALNELIAPDGRAYVNSLLSPLDMTLGDVAEPLGEAFSSFEKKSFEIKYSKTDEGATYTLIPTEEKIEINIDVHFKRQNGKWYFSPGNLIKAFPIETGLSLILAVKNSDGNKFLECVLPEESWKLKFGLAALGISKDKALEEFVKSAGLSEEGEDFPAVRGFEIKEDEMTVIITPAEDKNIRLKFLREEGHWYLSVWNLLSQYLSPNT